MAPSGRRAVRRRALDEALDIAVNALRRVVAEHGNEAIFGGSYGWASAGRFHHSQSQLHRFLNQFGGYTYSVQSYSTGTAQVIIPHVLGVPALQLMNEAPTIEDVLEHTRLVVSFGGISMKNTQINQGGIGDIRRAPSFSAGATPASRWSASARREMTSPIFSMPTGGRSAPMPMSR